MPQLPLSWLISSVVQTPIYKRVLPDYAIFRRRPAHHRFAAVAARGQQGNRRRHHRSAPLDVIRLMPVRQCASSPHRLIGIFSG
jgi:hypothetical protein